MSDPPEAIKLARQWIERAEEDFRMAEYALTMPENCPYGMICYHCQQCVEKYIKTILVWRSIEFPRIHDIGELSDLLPRETRIPLTEADQELLTNYATGVRYPGDREPITRADAEKALSMAREVKEAFAKILHGESGV